MAPGEKPAQSTPPGWLEQWQAWLALLVRVVVIGMAGVWLSSHFSWYWWRLEKLVHLTVMLAAFCVFLGVLATLLRRYRLALGALVLAFGFAWPALSLFFGRALDAPPAADAGKKVRTLMAFNLYGSNATPDLAAAALVREDVDILFLTEANPRWVRRLTPLLQGLYPYQISASVSGNWLLSKFPLEHGRNVKMNYSDAIDLNRASGEWRVRGAEPRAEDWIWNDLSQGTAVVDGKRLRLVGIHPPTPQGPRKIWLQRALAPLYHNSLTQDPTTDAAMLLGDFNTTPFSPTFRHILRVTGLRDTSRGVGYEPTWGPRINGEPLLPWLGVPIDHILVSERVKVISREVGPALGSDHRWVKIQFYVD